MEERNRSEVRSTGGRLGEEVPSCAEEAAPAEPAAAAAEAAATLKALPPPKDLSHLYSIVTKNRNQSAIKAFYKFMQIPGISNFSGGESGSRPGSPLRDAGALTVRLRLTRPC